jgi:hypothetical protein
LIARDILAALYVGPRVRFLAQDFGNESKLRLPFSVGANAYARSNSGIPLSHCPSNAIQESFQWVSANECAECAGSRGVAEWAERVQMGWGVDGDGVMGGIEEFREANTEERWQKYQVPVSW